MLPVRLSGGWLEGHLYPELYGPGQTNVEHSVRVARDNADIVRGIKGHAEIGGISRWGLEVVKIGKEIARQAGIPLYVHLGQLWPTREDAPDINADDVVRELVPLLEEGDVLAHPFTRHPGGFISMETGEVHPVVWAALERGVTVDVGHGSHFSFEMAEQVMRAGIRPYTLGADMHGYNVNVPDITDSEDRQANPFAGRAPFSLTNAMSKLLYLGMPLEEVVATVTANPAKMIGMSDTLGSLQVGREADISVLNLESGRFEMADNSGVRVVTDTMVTPAFTLRAAGFLRRTAPSTRPSCLFSKSGASPMPHTGDSSAEQAPVTPPMTMLPPCRAAGSGWPSCVRIQRIFARIRKAGGMMCNGGQSPPTAGHYIPRTGPCPLPDFHSWWVLAVEPA